MCFYYNPDPCEANQKDTTLIEPNGWSGGITFQALPATDVVADVSPGICVGDGADTLTFEARTSRYEGRFKFGSTIAGENVTEFWRTVTNVWARFSIPLPANYNNLRPGQVGVEKGFTIVADPIDHDTNVLLNRPVGGSYLQIRNMTWTKTGDN